ncbi:hypothetical protein AJ87_35115 [Rhizobium yanglingense]|nr:hypothetical protein AJ87_35115 [Rhizobium yanglingense]
MIDRSNSKTVLADLLDRHFRLAIPIDCIGPCNIEFNRIPVSAAHEFRRLTGYSDINARICFSRRLDVRGKAARDNGKRSAEPFIEKLDDWASDCILHETSTLLPPSFVRTAPPPVHCPSIDFKKSSSEADAFEVRQVAQVRAMAGNTRMTQNPDG